MSNMVSTSALAKANNLEVKDLFALLQESGFIESKDNRTLLTAKGKEYGEFKEGWYDKKGKKTQSYIVWNESIIKKLNLKSVPPSDKPQKETNKKDFRDAFKAEFRTESGHFVRSKSEVLIANFLYQKRICFAYEKKLPIEENVYSDFYIPSQNLWIEYWGYENKPEYLNRKRVKQDLYKKYDLSLIELNEKEVKNLDDYFPQMLLKYNIKVS